MGNRATLVRLLVVLLAMASCSVKEDRTSCPCNLFVSLGALPQAPVELQILDGRQHLGQVLDRDSIWLVPVDKGTVRVLGVSGAAKLGAEGYVAIPLGEDCPEVFLAAHRVNTQQDTAWCHVRLHKHFCTLSLLFDGPPGWGTPYTVQIRGRVAGLYPDGSPRPGDFRYALFAGASCRIPRQEPDDELWLDITMPEGVLRSFALGTYLLQAGYDWRAADLKDVRLRIDLSVTTIRLQMDEWKVTLPLGITI